MKKVTISSLQAQKQSAEKIAALTAYDASFAKLFDEQNIDVLLIGDSLGMVLQGQDDTLAVTIDDIAYHTRAVRRGTQRAFVIADLPFMSYATPNQTYSNAAKIMAAGASMVKLEGGQWLCETITGLVQRGVPVCAHMGLTPQSVHVFGGFKVQGRHQEKAEQMVEEAIAVQNAGAQLLVLECVPSSLGKRISEELTIPVIGIGAGKDTDGQILVMHDMFGISANYMPKFSKNYLVETGDLRKAVKKYISDVRSGAFPSTAHSFE
ncbi:3-methyl-2-oxobutanoate hydroxymethyltransferase [Alteromonas pelagimontana]|uniref:3-methyl-2-oxobutanoate hydroxymethyltransferase n=1 Tax=Alteromonas pelagimontana TaxID=1858656 RepID=A0A6M4MFN7_9ALTE|nr:3-methyl-2-oxobutanoate hydroxymethyltransferase [Alteromonas pelagimontana]QJR81435.1 3-methyl-2-oxobutanoate hydroxymethyltransferase [Alteromonas pelagimontana]